MPSHVTHLLFAEECCAGAGIDELARGPNRAYLALGAQGPDMFYHNQRRKPSGLTYGSLMHRHGYGTAVSHMAAWAWSRSLPLDSWAGAWTIGYATHAVLDRFTHPFINYFSGWVQPGDPHTEQYRSMHPFLERLIDVAMLKAERGMHPNRLDFATTSSFGDTPPGEWLDMMATALSNSYRVARKDEEIVKRLRAAYLDASGYYRFTNLVDEHYLEEALVREERGEIGSRWLSIVHPQAVPDSIDVLNEGHAAWTHPCDESQVFTDSFRDRFDLGLEKAVTTAAAICEAWNDTASEQETRRLRIESSLGNWNLSDGRNTERPCRKMHANPLPLRELQEQIRSSLRDGRGDGV